VGKWDNEELVLPQNSNMVVFGRGELVSSIGRNLGVSRSMESRNGRDEIGSIRKGKPIGGVKGTYSHL
jgi:hypothetical protein